MGFDEQLLALDVLGRYEGAWTVVLQDDNVQAAWFWRQVANQAFGPGAWPESERPIPGLPAGPPDHSLETV